MLNGMLKENIRYIPAKVERNKRVAIYCRVSTIHVSQEESLEAQIEGLKHLVENNTKWKLFKIYSEKDYQNFILGNVLAISIMKKAN